MMNPPLISVFFGSAGSNPAGVEFLFGFLYMAKEKKSQEAKHRVRNVTFCLCGGGEKVSGMDRFFFHNIAEDWGGKLQM